MIELGRTTAKAHGASPNEREAATALAQAETRFGAGSPQADAARRHLRLIRNFNEQYAWFRH